MTPDGDLARIARLVSASLEGPLLVREWETLRHLLYRENERAYWMSERHLAAFGARVCLVEAGKRRQAGRSLPFDPAFMARAQALVRRVRAEDEVASRRRRERLAKH